MSQVLKLFSQKNIANSDHNRRTIFEVNCPIEGFSLQGFDVKARLPLGKHFHEKKHETFKILAGGGIVFLYPVSYIGEQIDPAKIQRLQLTAGSVVHMPPMTAHTFYLEPGSRMVCFSTAAFDEENKDMRAFPELVEKEETRN